MAFDSFVSAVKVNTYDENVILTVCVRVNRLKSVLTIIRFLIHFTYVIDRK